MYKFSFLLLLAILSCTPEPKGTQFLFALETTGTYSVQMRDEVGEFIVLDTLELKGNDAFMVQFDTARIISFLPLKGELPVIHAVVGPNSKQLTISKDGFISGDAENNWLGAQRKMQLDLIDYTDSMDAIKSTYVDSNTFVGLEALNNAYYAYADGYRQRILDSLQQHPERLSNLLTIYHRIGQQPALDYAVDGELLQGMYQKLQNAYPGSPDVTTYAMWLGKYEEMLAFTAEVEAAEAKFQPGHPFPELKLETPEVQSVHIKRMSLEDQTIAVWASWCSGCRNELRMTADQGRQEEWIYLSIDGLPQQRSPLAEWYGALQEDKLGGTHLSDLMGSRSRIISGLGITELPVYFKVKDGVITDRSSSIETLN